MLYAAVFSSLGFLAVAYYLVKRTRSITALTDSIIDLKSKNERLSERAQLFTLVERISHLGSWEFFVQNNVVKWSEEMYRIHGIKDENFDPGNGNFLSAIAPEYREKVNKELNNAIVNVGSFAVEYQIIQPSGTRRYVLGQGFYVEKDCRIVGTLQDITELKDAVLKLKINESLLREAEMVSHSGSWEWRDGNEFMLWSDEMYKIHGYFPHSVYANYQVYQTMIHEEDLQLFIDNFYHARNNKKSFKINYRIITPAGEIRHVLTTAEHKKIGLNEDYAFIGNTQDVTQLREAQVLLEEKMQELNRSNLDLEQFAYVASHDLQEPLRKIQAFGERLRDKFSANLNEEGLDYLDRMRNAAERMRALIDDLLTFSKATRERKKFVRTKLSAVMANVLQELDYTIESRGAKVILDLGEEELDGIETQLVQLFFNLVGNSLKFTSPEIKPYIEISAVTQYGNEINLPDLNIQHQYCVIKVKDNGIGFDKEDGTKIFDIFYRLHPRAAYEGTGIGLAICRKITDNHSGFIFTTSEIGKGTTFTVVLPKKQVKLN